MIWGPCVGPLDLLKDLLRFYANDLKDSKELQL